MAKSDCMTAALSRVQHGISTLKALGELSLGAWASGRGSAENLSEVLLYVSAKLDDDMVVLDSFLCESGVLAETADA